MNRIVFWKNLTKLHRWAGLVLCVQITLWFASGFFMSFFDIENVRGKHIAEKRQWPLVYETIVPMAGVLDAAPQGVLSSSLISVVGEPVYRVEYSDEVKLFNAATGQAWLALGESHIREAAQFYYKGEADVKSLQSLSVAPIEYRGALPIWQVEYDDNAKTRLYIHPETAELKAVRTRLWRAFDFMWMLHIMDYKNRDNINLWWLKLFSGAALLFALSGVALLAHKFILRPKPQKKA
ncbi:MAG: PepSY domain-containing protein [Maricaulaceae bacterium]